MEPKQKQHPVVDMTGDGSKVQCYKGQNCIGTWNFRSMNQGKLEVVKQEMARVNTDILGISELKWMGMKVLVAQLRSTLCDPMDCSPPDSSVHGISQARMLEWVAISYSNSLINFSCFLYFWFSVVLICVLVFLIFLCFQVYLKFFLPV